MFFKHSRTLAAITADPVPLLWIPPLAGQSRWGFFVFVLPLPHTLTRGIIESRRQSSACVGGSPNRCGTCSDHPGTDHAIFAADANRRRRVGVSTSERLAGQRRLPPWIMEHNSTTHRYFSSANPTAGRFNPYGAWLRSHDGNLSRHRRAGSHCPGSSDAGSGAGSRSRPNGNLPRFPI